MEYQRRLSELNHAHEKQVADQQTYVSDDKFRGWQGEVNAFKNETQEKLALLTGRSSGISSTQTLVFQILAQIATVVIIFVMLRK